MFGKYRYGIPINYINVETIKISNQFNSSDGLFTTFIICRKTDAKQKFYFTKTLNEINPFDMH